MDVQTLRQTPRVVLELLLTLANVEKMAAAKNPASKGAAVTYAYLMGQLGLTRSAVFANVLKAKQLGYVAPTNAAAKGGRGQKQTVALTEKGRALVRSDANGSPKAAVARG